MFSRLLLVFLIPAFILYTTPIPQSTPHSPNISIDFNALIDSCDETNLSFDQLLHLIEIAENPNAISKLSPANHDKLVYLMTALAKEGILPGQEDLEDEIDADIEDLHTDTGFAFIKSHAPLSNQYTLDHLQDYRFIQCGWLSKSWKKTCKFVRKNKKAIIIGAAVIVAVAITGTAIRARKNKAPAASPPPASKPSPAPQASASPTPSSAPQKTSSEDVEKISAEFKQKLANTNPELIPPTPASKPTVEDIRDYSSIITQQIASATTDQFTPLAHSPNKSSCPDDTPLKIDQSFGTNLAYDLLLPPPDVHPDAVPHYIVSQKALDHKNYPRALQALNKTIEIDPNSPSAYLNRSYTNALLGNHSDAQDDFQSYHDRASSTFITKCIIAGHFAQGLKNGAFESGKQLVGFAGDIITHPIHTSQQVYHALSHLVQLAYTQQWKELGAALAPEIKHLIENWDILPDTIRSEQAGYILGKYGADFLLPGAATKILVKGTRAAKQLAITARTLKNAERLLPLEVGLSLEGTQELSAISNSLKTANRTLLLESIASMKSGAKIEKVMQLEKRISTWLGEGARFIKNKAGDPVFLSKDGLRCVRFDFNRTKPHHNPHAHVEMKVNGKWIKSGQIYPTDVPHN